MTGSLRGRATYLPAYYLCAYKAPYKALHLSRILYKSPLFMQNKANYPDDQMNVSKVITKDYRKKDDFAVQKTNPIQTQYKAKQSQYKAKQSQFQTHHLYWEMSIYGTNC
jgi:hypothetical protein